MFSVYSNFQNTKNFTIIILKLLLKLIKTKPLKNLKNKKKVNIHVNDWLTSGLFAYNIYLGLILSKEYNVVFLFDRFNLYNSFQSYFINKLCCLILLFIKKKFKINFIILGKFSINIKSSFKKRKNLNQMYKFNSIRYERDASFKFLKNKKYYNKIKLASKTYDHIEYLIKNKIITKNDGNIISGGYLNSSYLLNILFREKKITFYTFDSGTYKNNYCIFYCKNGVAGKMEESEEAFNNLKKNKYFNKIKLNEIKKIIINEINKRRLNKSAIKYQETVKKNKIRFKNFAMITINSGWDANSLDSSYIFKDYLTFLKMTSNFFKKKFPNINLIIKNHPYRLQADFKKDDSIEKFSKKISKNNVYFIDSNESNFYEIIKKCKLLISVSSTTINEAIILNTPAISAGKDQYYYFNLGINPKNQKEFFKQIAVSLRGKNLKKSLKDKAIILYYLNNIKKYLLSEFNPQTISWLKYNIEDLAKSKNVLIL